MFKTMGKVWRGTKLAGKTVANGIEAVGSGLEQLNNSLEEFNRELAAKNAIQSSINECHKLKRVFSSQLASALPRCPVSSQYLKQGVIFVDVVAEMLEITKANLESSEITQSSDYDFFEVTDGMSEGISDWLSSHSPRQLEVLLSKRSLQKSISKFLSDTTREFKSILESYTMSMADKQKLKELIVKLEMIKIN